MRVSLVVAVAENGVIGKDGGLPWRLSSDLKRFKRDTMGKPIIMGRKTFESIGKPLPGRSNIVVTRQMDYRAPGIDVVGSLSEALQLAETRQRALGGPRELCIIGGGELYQAAMAVADRLYVTHVRSEPEGDTYFPAIDGEIWHKVVSEPYPAGERDSAPTEYAVYERRAR